MLRHDSPIEPTTIDDDAFDESFLEPVLEMDSLPVAASATQVPVPDLASPPLHAARESSHAPGMSREINLPVKLEIGGRSISFELKISLDLTEISSYAQAADVQEMESR